MIYTWNNDVLVCYMLDLMENHLGFKWDEWISSITKIVDVLKIKNLSNKIEMVENI